jgi:hypothetical protein
VAAVISDQLERNFFVEGFDEGAPAGVHLIDPELQPVMDRQRDAGVAPGGGIKRPEFDLGRRIGRLYRNGRRRGQNSGQYRKPDHGAFSLNFLKAKRTL